MIKGVKEKPLKKREEQIAPLEGIKNISVKNI